MDVHTHHSPTFPHYLSLTNTCTYTQPGLAQHLTIPLYGQRPSKKSSSQSKDMDLDEEDGDEAESQTHMSHGGRKVGGDR